MGKFLGKVVIFLILTWVLSIAVAMVVPANTTAPLYPIHDKMARLDTLPGRRLVIVANSSSAFGIVSPRLRAATGLNVVNAGLTSVIGMRFMLHEVAHRVRPGDVVAVMMEYDQWNKDNYDGAPGGLALSVSYIGLETVNRLNADQLWKMLCGFPSVTLRNIITLKPGDDYCGLNYNEFGDEYIHWKKKSSGNRPIDYDLNDSGMSPSVFDEVAELIQEMRTKDVEVLLLPQITVQSNYDFYRKANRVIYAAMARRGVPFDAPANTFVVPDSLMYDTPNHLIYQGAVIVTDRLSRLVTDL